MHNSSSGAGLVKIAGFDPNMTVRVFLVKLLPDMDLPSVHAVDTAFKEDGVETMRDLLLYLEGGVLEMKDLKNYSKQGKLDMAHTLKLSRAVEHLLEERAKTDGDNHNGPALATHDRPPRKVVAWSGHTLDKEKGQLGLINRAIAEAFDAVSNQVKSILKDADDLESDAFVSPYNSTVMPSPEHEQEREGQEDKGQSYAARRSSNIDMLGPQTVHPPPPPPLPPRNKRDSMTNMASIVRSKALRSGSLLKPSGRRKSDTNRSNHGDNANTNLKSSHEQDEGTISP